MSGMILEYIIYLYEYIKTQLRQKLIKTYVSNNLQYLKVEHVLYLIH